MKKFLLSIFILLFSFQSFSQLLSWTPDFIQETSDPVVITMNANYGNHGLLNYTPTSDVYVHIGVITNKSTSPSDWLHVVTTWGVTNPAWQAAYLGNNEWSFTITGGLRTFFGLTDPTETIQKIAILFRSGNGSTVQRNADASDMYVPVYGNGLYARIDNPYRQPFYVPAPETITKTVGDVLPIVAKASLAGSTIQIYFNGSLLSTITGTKDSISTTISAFGTQTIIAKVTNGANTSSDTLSFYVASANTIAPLPAGVTDGINYYPSPDSVTLVLYAPNKKSVTVLGDFNNWTASSTYQMNETPDGLRYWITLKGLTSGTQYAYQYLIDNSLQVADYNSQLVLDKNADQYIPAGNFPGLKAFPIQAAGTLAGVLETGQTPYTWNDNSFVKPDKRNLVIYELLIRDFVATQSWNTLTDTLNYLKKLGINAIEVLPFCNFEGASSWGYNPNFFFAPDKVYGTPDAVKHFVDVCHQNGIAVIMDLAMQDVFGSSPLASMYWNSSTNTPTLQNPWLDSLPTHPFNVGYQFNHSSQATIDLRNRVYAYWINNYHLDGYRFDLAGGYTQTDYLTNGKDWQNTYDQGRVDTWNNIYSELQSIKPGTYCILESFVNRAEQIIYTNAGMLTWGNGANENYAFTQASMGYYNSSADFSNGIYSSAGLTQPGMVTYQESHDETRLMFKNENFGASAGTYNVKDTATGLKRAAMTTAFWAMMPGPKMMWMFGELGYDYSQDACSNGTIVCGNTDPKPIRWDYFTQPDRLALYNVYSKLLNLRNVPAYLSTFTTGTVNKDLNFSTDPIKWMNVSGTSLQVMVYGNFDVGQRTGTISFPSTGTWYNLFTGADTTVSSTSLTNVTLQPGQYYVYVNTAAALPVTLVSFTGKRTGNSNLLTWQVANELNMSNYELEKSNDGQNFYFVSSIIANGSKTYSYTDNDQNNSAIEYYRLKSVDLDGEFNYSGIVMIRTAINSWHAQINPNPVENILRLQIESPAPDKAALIFTDVSGRQLYKQNISIEAGNNSFEINKSIIFAPGIYFLSIYSTDQIQNIKFIKNH
ncbi:MAG TPA: alpha-amylase family glycosyl hydrolase [Hanamia sp.]|nr:alpha-amylase family glycosyl hydrolase [Hanamia sp.]